MRNPTFVPTESEDRLIRKSERDLREILRDSDDRARRLFERRETERPSGPQKLSDNDPPKKEGE